MTCRDGREADQDSRGGTRLAQCILARWEAQGSSEFRFRGVECTSQCKRPCIVSLSAPQRFTYVFGDLDPEDPDHVEALFELAALYNDAPEGFLERAERPKPLRASILARLPSWDSTSKLVSQLETHLSSLSQQSSVVDTKPTQERGL